MMKKRPYSPPALTNLTLQQAKKIIADGRNCTEEEAAELLESVRQQQHNPRQNGPVIETKAASLGMRSESHVRWKSC
jgi:hypothetical protein